MLKSVAVIVILLLPIPTYCATCSSLSSKFARNPSSLTIDELSELRKCVDDELRKQLDGTSGNPPVPKPKTSPPPPMPPPPPPTPAQ